MTVRQPSLFVPHGGGPCFFMPDPAQTWTRMADFLRALPASLPAPPRAILLVSGHWETDGFAFTIAERPALIYDYRCSGSEAYIALARELIARLPRLSEVAA